MRLLEQHWLVSADIRGGFHWYEQKEKGLGRRFNREVHAALKRLRTDALLYSIRFSDVRRANLPSFPYGVFYFLGEDAVIIIGVLHSARDSQAELDVRRQTFGE